MRYVHKRNYSVDIIRNDTKKSSFKINHQTKFDTISFSLSIDFLKRQFDSANRVESKWVILPQGGSMDYNIVLFQYS
jgi:hypothetical protein